MFSEGVLAERVGFEPTLEFPLNTLSKRAPSATRPSLQGVVCTLEFTITGRGRAGIGGNRSGRLGMNRLLGLAV